MNYELAKKLRDEGFPQNGYFGAMWYSNVSHTRLPYRKDDKVLQVMEKPDVPGIRIPTLSELIDACGHEFNGLYPKRIEVGEDFVRQNKWIALGTPLNSHGQYKVEGSSPKEAVANLYFGLKKRK